MITIKGTVLLDAISALEERRGRAWAQRVVGSMAERYRGVLQGRVYPTRKYALDVLVEFVRVGLELAGEPESVLVERSQAVVDAQLRGLYRSFVKLGSPQFVLKRIAAIHQTYFGGVTVQVERPLKRTALVRYQGFEPHQGLVEQMIEGFYRQALEISGASEIEFRTVVPIALGRPFCEFYLCWK